jgi:hypothetical protein
VSAFEALPLRALNNLISDEVIYVMIICILKEDSKERTLVKLKE